MTDCTLSIIAAFSFIFLLVFLFVFELASTNILVSKDKYILMEGASHKAQTTTVRAPSSFSNYPF